MASKLETYFRLLDKYEERFGVGPPDFHFRDDDEGIELMQKAIDRGRPIDADDLPDMDAETDF